MQRRKLVNLLVLASLLVMLVAPVASGQFSPTIFAVAQDVVDGVVNVTRVVSDGPGWVVVHADDGGNPGAAIGQAAVRSGISANIKVVVDSAAVTPMLHLMLHTDAGVEGTFEFPGDDVPVDVDGTVVMAMIDVPVVGASLAGAAEAAGTFSSLLAAVETAGLTSELAEGGPYTVFAPTDDAFAALPEGTLEALTPEELSSLLQYHIVPGALESSAITESVMVESLLGEELDVQVGDDGITVNGASVVTADVVAYNGVIHVIDTVLTPPAAEEVAEETTEAAPATETAVVTETAVMTDTTAVTETAATTETDAATETAEVTPAEPGDIVGTLSAAGSFRTLASALTERGLEDALRGEGPYTVFAPSDGAFSALPLSDRISLYADEGVLEAVLLNHVVEGLYMSTDLADGDTLTAVGGGTLAVTVDENGTYVNGVEIESADVTATNGVIHVLSGVILPGAEAVAEEAAAEESTTEETATETTTEASAAATPEATPEATTETATETVTVTETAEAPTTVPSTGAPAQSNALVTVLVSALLVVMLGAFALVGRRA